MRVVIAGDGPTASGSSGSRTGTGSNGRATSPAACREAELADLYARCRAVYYAPVDEDYGMVPYEAFLAEKPVVTTHDAGGPLDVVHDGATGLVIEPRADELARACTFLGANEERRGDVGQAGRVPPSADVGPRGRAAARVRGRVLQPDAARAVGHRRLLALLLPALATTESTSSGAVAPACAPRCRQADIALYHVGNDPEYHWWIVEGSGDDPASSCCTTSSYTI